MARFKRHADVHDAARRWRDVALAADGSIFTDRLIWSRTVAEELADTFDLEDGAEESDFEARLKVQLASVSSEARILAAEMLWVMMLFPTNISGPKKREKVRAVLGWAGVEVPDDDPALRVLDTGIGNTGQGYLTHQAFELNFLMAATASWKRLGGEQRGRLLSDPWAFADWLNGVPDKGYRQLRNVVPFLLFPEAFEDSSYIRHKEAILRAFERDLAEAEPWTGAEPTHSETRIDVDLHRLRGVLESRYGQEELSFYRPPLNEQWREQAPVPRFEFDKAVFDQAMRGFLEIFDDFETFENTGVKYQENERRYKDELAKRFKELVSSTEALERPAEEVGVAFVDGVLALLQSKLDTINEPQNLLGWRTFDFLRHLDTSEKVVVARILVELLDDEVSAPSRVERFNVDIWPILERHDSVSYAVSRSFPTLFLMLWDPENEIFIRTQAFNQLARSLTGSPLFKNKRLDAAEYRAARAFAEVIRERLVEQGLAPSDMIDVQGWIWCALAGLERAKKPEAVPGEVGPERPEDTETTMTTLMAALRDQGLYFDAEVVANYLVALETRRLVILAGISGTGKTRLAMSVAKFFQEGASDTRPIDGTSRVIAVRPDWTDPRALLGYHNPILDRYVPTEFLRILLAAREEEQRAAEQDRSPHPYFVILDEMNLARVEHYFADFLSALESDSAIELHDDETEAVVEEGGSSGPGVPPRLWVPKNVFFTGTVNVDETTHMFSPKVLDRAFTIELNRVDLARYGSEVDEEETALGLNELPRPFQWARRPGVEDWNAFGQFDGGKLQALVRDLNQDLTPSHRHFGYRVANEIARFVGLVWERSDGDVEAAWQALDLAILQKVLPKFHGTEQELDAPLRILFRLATDDEAEEALELRKLVRSGPVPPETQEGPRPRLPRTAAKVLRMRDRLQAQGFTSFLE